MNALQQCLHSNERKIRIEIALYAACQEIDTNNSIETIAEACQIGLDTNLCNKYGETLLHIAVRKHRVDLLKLLLSYNADPNKSNKEKVTPLHLAAFSNHKEMVATLLQYNADTNLQDSTGITALHAAVFGNYLDVAELLLVHGAQINISERKGVLPIHVAVYSNYLEMTRLLLKWGASTDQLDHKDRSCLKLVCENSRTSTKDKLVLMKLLLQAGADPNLKDTRGATVMHEEYNLDTLKLLIDYGGDIRLPYNGNTCLDLICNVEISKELEEYERRVRRKVFGQYYKDNLK